jgi:ubiquinone/menaquinone biosynthesis C-methylase UbiE
MLDSDLHTILENRDAVIVRDYDAALDLADLDPQDTVLDVATGSGRMLLQLLKRGYSVVSGDIDSEAFDRARERLGEMADQPSLILLNALDMQFEDGAFRSVTLANAIHEMENPRGALDEIGRVLAADGKLLVVEFNLFGFELMEVHHKMQGKGDHPRGEMSTEDTDRYLRSSFESVDTREFGITHAWVAFGKRAKER